MNAVHAPERAAARAADANGHGPADQRRRLTTETKAAFKTTEFVAFIAVLAGILVSAAVVDAGDFAANQAWLYATILTVGYMISRGLAKSGTSDAYDADRS